MVASWPWPRETVQRSAERERLVWLWQAEDVEEWHMVAREDINATTAVPLRCILAYPPKATSIWYPRQVGKGAWKDSVTELQSNLCNSAT